MMFTGLLILLLAGLFTLMVIGVVATAYVMSHPPRRTAGYAVAHGLPTDPSEAGAEFTTAEVAAADGRGIEVWLASGRDPSGPMFVLLHGWADGRMGELLWMRIIAPLASQVVMFDQRGHGDSPHRAFTWGEAEVEDALRVVEHAAGLEPRRPIVLLGYSLGAAVAIRAAAKRGDLIAGVVADSPYRRPVEAVAGLMRLNRLPAWPIAWLATGLLEVRNRGVSVDIEEQARRMSKPLLVMHGALDSLTPMTEARRIAEASPEGSLCEFPQADHMGAARDEPEACRAAIADWVAKLSSPPKPRKDASGAESS